MDLQPKQFSPTMMPKRRPTPVDIPEDTAYSLHSHAAKQATMKGFSHEDVLRAANDPHTSYESGSHPGQMRHIRGGIVAVVDPAQKKVITVYENVKQTPLRPDQKKR